MAAGTYGYWPPGMKHFVWTKGETVVQFHGMGPWSIQYVNPTMIRGIRSSNCTPFGRRAWGQG
jgi:hypothetical protein